MTASLEAETPQRITETSRQPIRAAVLWGVVVGGIQAASPLAFWWLTPATVYALELALIAAVYIGFAVADGRRQVIAVECLVAAAFVVLAAASVTGPAWLLVLGYAGHGAKDLLQHRRRSYRLRRQGGGGDFSGRQVGAK